MKLWALAKLPSALAATSTKTVVTAALLAGVTSAATASVVVIGSNALSPTPHQAASGPAGDGFIVTTTPGTTPLIVVPKSSTSASSVPGTAAPSESPIATPSPTGQPAPSGGPHVIVVDNQAPPSQSPDATTPARPGSPSPSFTPPSRSPSPSSPPARPNAPAPNPSSKPTARPTPTPTSGLPACGAFTSAQISWAAQQTGISEASLKAAMTANPAAICCLPYDANCRPGDRDDLVNLAKQVAALTDPHKAAVHSAAVHSADVDKADADTGHDRGKAGEHGNHGNHGNHGHGHSESARAR